MLFFVLILGEKMRAGAVNTCFGLVKSVREWCSCAWCFVNVSKTTSAEPAVITISAITVFAAISK
jgi:hypothetical protein